MLGMCLSYIPHVEYFCPSSPLQREAFCQMYYKSRLGIGSEQSLTEPAPHEVE